MMTSSKVFLKVLAVSFGLLLFSAFPAHSGEVHVSNIQITSSGSLAWIYDPWLSVATAGVFDDPNGWTQAYDDDPGATGQAFASVSTLYASAQSYASSNLGKIDLSADLNGGGQFAYASGELYNLFQVDGPDPVNATFSLDWNAKINGDFSIQMLVRDGINDISDQVFFYGGNYSNSGLLTVSGIFEPGVLYSLNIGAITEPVPEPAPVFLVVAGGLFGWRSWKRAGKARRTPQELTPPVQRIRVTSEILHHIFPCLGLIALFLLTMLAPKDGWAGVSLDKPCIPCPPTDCPFNFCDFLAPPPPSSSTPPAVDLPIVIDPPVSPREPIASFISYSEGTMGDTVDLPNLGASLKLSLAYASYNADGSEFPADTVLGFGWTHSYDLFITEYRFDAFLRRGNGSISKFKRKPNGSYTPVEGWFETLSKPDANTYILTSKQGTEYRFEKLVPSPFLMPGPPFYLKRITDRNGLQTTLSYNSQSRLAGITDPYGRVTTFTYNANKKIATITDPLSRVTQLFYGPNSYDLSKIIDTAGNTTEYTYNGNHQITRKKDPAGHIFNYLYSNGKPVGIQDSAGNYITRFANNKGWAIDTQAALVDSRRLLVPGTTTKTDGRGNIWLYDYEKHGFLTKITAPDGAITSYTYDPATLKVATKTDANGHTTRYQYDNLGNLAKRIDANGNEIRYEYNNPFNFVTKISWFASGASTPHMKTTYDYDIRGNLLRETRDVGGLNLVSELTYYTAGVSVPENPSGTGGLVKDEILHNGATLQTTRFKYDAFGNRTEVIDPENNATRYEYDIVGNKTKMIDANGHIWLYVPYDGMNRLLAETDPLGFVTRYTYDGNGNRTEVKKQVTNAPDTFETAQYQYDLRNRLVKETRDPGGLNLVTMTAYDNNDNRIQMTDPRGKVTTYAYDVQNRLAKVTDALGNMTQNKYDPVGNRIQATDANGHLTCDQYDAINRLSVDIRKMGTSPCTLTASSDIVTRHFYDTGASMSCDHDPGSPICNGPTPGSSNIAHTIDPEGNHSYFKYDKVDRLWITISKVTDTADACDADDWCQYTKYDPAGNVTAQVDANGNRSNSTYYANNWRHTEANALNETTTYTYDGVGNVKTVQSPGDNLTTHTYNARNELIQVDDKIGRVASHGYDGIGNRKQDCDGNNHCSAYDYDLVNRLLAVTDPMGKITRYAYDQDGNLVKTTDRESNVNCNQYDDINRRILQLQKVGDSDCAVVDADDVWAKTHYDPVGNVISLTTAKHGSTPAQCNGASPPADCQTTTYNYDPVNRLLQETYPDAGVRQFAYDDAGNLVERIDQQGRTTGYVYNDLYYLTKRDYQVDADDSFTYDVGGRMLEAERDGWVDTFQYDDANRVLQATQDGKQVSYTYDIPKRCRTLTYPSLKVVEECRDFRERLEDIDDGSLATYAYDLGNRVLTRGYGNGTTATYTYNDNNWITSLTHTKAGSILIAGFGHDYDKEGNKTFQQNLLQSNNSDCDPSLPNRDKSKCSEAYQYDALYRLIDFKVGTLVGSTVPVPLTQTQYDLDKLGNWDHKIKNGVTQTRQHNAVNEITQIDAVPLSYDDNGNLTEDKRYDYTYDQENRLLTVSYVDAGGVQVAGEYRYDALSRRIVKKTGLSRGNKETHYFYDDERIIEEHDPLSNPEASYVYGNYIDEVLTMDRGLHTYYHHQNALWSVEAITDGAANVVETYAYDAYGHPTITDGLGNVLTNVWGTAHSAIVNPWMFTGRQYDEESGLYFYRARVYDNGKGRFLQRDPLGYVDGKNLYWYAKGNPASLFDPYGLKVCCGDELRRASPVNLVDPLSEECSCIAGLQLGPYGPCSPVGSYTHKTVTERCFSDSSLPHPLCDISVLYCTAHKCRETQRFICIRGARENIWAPIGARKIEKACP